VSKVVRLAIFAETRFPHAFYFKDSLEFQDWRIEVGIVALQHIKIENKQIN
jgi:hypothetical protein